MLRGIEAPVGRHAALALTVETLGLNGQPFEKIFNLRGDNLAAMMGEVETNQLFAEYLQQIELVIETVDRMDG